MKKRTWTILLTTLGVVILGACRSINPSNHLLTLTPQNLIQTPTPFINQDTRTPLVPLTEIKTQPSPIPSQVVPTSMETELLPQCPVYRSLTENNSDIRGVIAIEPTSQSSTMETSQISLLSLVDGEKINLLNEGEKAVNARPSPDGKWLAYMRSRDNSSTWEIVLIQVSEIETAEEIVIPFEEGWWRFTWLDNHNLVIYRTSDQYDETYTPLLTINPFTQERYLFPADPDDLWNLGLIPYLQGTGLVSYDPSKRYRVYQSMADELVLEDLHTDEELLRVLAPTYDAAPRWSADGQSFIFTNALMFTYQGPEHYELFRVFLDGRVEQLTELSKEYEFTYIRYYKWSPDGQTIVFWLATNPDSHFDVKLAFLDVVSKEVTITCMESKFEDNHYNEIYWSPDSQYILYGIQTKEAVHRQVEILNINEGWVMKIADQSLPDGWFN